MCRTFSPCWSTGSNSWRPKAFSWGLCSSTAATPIRRGPGSRSDCVGGRTRRQVVRPMPLQAHDSTERLPSAREHVTDVVDLDDVPFDHAYDIAIVGLGYVGLPTALALHDAGRIVLGVDVDPARIEAIRRGRVDVLDSDRERLAVALGDDRFEMTGDERLLGRAG